MKEDYDFLLEWAVFGHLDSKTDLELILLKGHLLLETTLEIALKRNNVINFKNFSFYRKIITYEQIQVVDDAKRELIISSLKKINQLRNKIAHDFYFDISNGEFEIWSHNILESLEGAKFSKYTVRTKLVHAFSTLAKNILDVQIENE